MCMWRPRLSASASSLAISGIQRELCGTRYAIIHSFTLLLLCELLSASRCTSSLQTIYRLEIKITVSHAHNFITPAASLLRSLARNHHAIKDVQVALRVVAALSP